MLFKNNTTIILMENLDIVNLIEKNPITKLSDTYNNKLLLEIKKILLMINNNYLYHHFIVI